MNNDSDRLFDVVKKVFGEKASDFGLDTTFEEIQMESLELLKLIIFIEEEFCVDIKKSVLGNNRKIKCFADFLDIIHEQ